MWIEELKDGRFKYFERYTDPYTGKYRRTSTILNSKSSRAQKQAKNILDEKIDKLLAKASTSNAYFTDVLQEWWEHHSQNLKHSTKYSFGFYVQELKENFGVGIKIGSIDTLYSQRYFDNQKPFIAKNRHLKMILNQCFNYAIDMGMISENPISRVRIPKTRKTIEDYKKVSQKYLEEKELRDLLRELYGRKPTYRLGLLAEFLSLSGVRFGEATAIEVENVDYENKRLEIHGTLDMRHGGFKNAVKTTPKTIASYREVSLTNREIEILKEMQKIKELDQHLRQNFHESDFIFVSKNGIPISNAFFNTTLKKANSRLDNPINKKISSHIFRHTLISRLAENNIPLRAIMDKVGHSDPKTTNAIYTHATENMNDNLMAVLEKY